MSKETLAQLKYFYDTLKTQLIDNKKFKKDTTLIGPIINLKSNARYNLLKNSAVQAHNIGSKQIFEELLLNNYVHETDRTGEYCITAKGIYYYEIENNLFANDNLLDLLDQKFFLLYSGNKALIDRERVIMFFMICIRAFSQDTALDLKKNVEVLNEVKELINVCISFLASENIIDSQTEEDIFGSRGNEHPVSNLIRHSDALLKKTKGVYKTIYPQKYYLAVAENGVIEIQKLGFIFWLIYGRDFPISKNEELSKFCNSLTYNVAVARIIDISKQTFHHPDYDTNISEAIFEYFEQRSVWDKARKKTK
jgi:hypothetical protein